ncbi:hypothetical protein HDR62_01230 [bacterium]|nr:hypothetical protein [bacterium]
MKKTAVFMAGVLAVASLLALMTSCKKDCVCTEKDTDGETYTETIFPENYNAKNCKELGSMLSGDGIVVNCK